ncbi:hypothetical protein SAMN05428975_1767 [Mucilaginibacter sp. OK268]|uniref:hypothetical protein n=1 Tax=Mucilaginibacter sp. OK268 TaxID=1881048 RepID=UPI00088FAEDE|nr:hypothetical protein [Mucilaginibacter sp. OK268]SDP55252.1 hypothetical protein SAMN05428975_1767 [Mucilaginibacter sp. OK268]
MKTLKPLLKLFFLFFVTLAVSCKKDLVKTNNLSSPTNKQITHAAIPPYDFNWETATYLPYKPSANTNPLQLPWNSGSTAIDPGIVSDYKKSDGWVLVHNTFSPDIVLNDPNYTYFFSLYNIYRGVLRFYVWQPASSIATTNITHGLNIYGSGATSSMLNFNTQEIIDPTTNLPKFQQILNQQVASAGGTWLAFQYEMAYDPNVGKPENAFPTLGLELSSKWTNITDVTINGNQSGTIQSTPGTSSGGGINFGSLLAGGVTTFFGSIKYANLINPRKDVHTYDDAVNSGLGGIVKGFLSGILGGGSATQPLNLTINTSIKLTGSFVNNGAIEDLKLILPGQSNSQTANGNTPKYDAILGVFNLTSKPIIQTSANYFSYDVEDPRDGSRQTDAGYNVTCFFDANSVKFVWNPAIINNSPTGATIQNINTDLIAIGPATGAGTAPGLINSNQTGGESAGNLNYAIFHNPTASRPAFFGYYTQLDSNEGGYPYTPPLAVRVSFDVVPNNGGPKATLVKTFWPSEQLPQ